MQDNTLQRIYCNGEEIDMKMSISVGELEEKEFPLPSSGSSGKG